MTATLAGQRLADGAFGLLCATEDLNRAAADIDSTTIEEAVGSLATLREQIGTLRQVEAGLERWIAACFRAEGWDLTHELPGIGMVEVRRSTTRRAWDWPELKSAWLNQYMARTGGEVTDPAAIRDAIFECFSISSGKVTGLRELGIDVEDYCSSEPGTPRVVIA
jgi:hypothetical protein